MQPRVFHAADPGKLDVAGSLYTAEYRETHIKGKQKHATDLSGVGSVSSHLQQAAGGLMLRSMRAAPVRAFDRSCSNAGPCPPLLLPPPPPPAACSSSTPPGYLQHAPGSRSGGRPRSRSRSGAEPPCPTSEAGRTLHRRAHHASAWPTPPSLFPSTTRHTSKEGASSCCTAP